MQDQLDAWRSFLLTSEMLMAGASQEIVFEIPDFILLGEKKCRGRPELHGKRCGQGGGVSSHEQKPPTQPCKGTHLKLTFSPPSTDAWHQPLMRILSSVCCPWCCQQSLLPSPLCPRQSWAGCTGAIPSLRAAWSISCTGFMEQEVWTSIHVEWCLVETSHIQPVSAPNTGSSGVSKLVSVKPLMSQNKVYALCKNKNSMVPQGAENICHLKKHCNVSISNSLYFYASFKTPNSAHSKILSKN